MGTTETALGLEVTHEVDEYGNVLLNEGRPGGVVVHGAGELAVRSTHSLDAGALIAKAIDANVSIDTMERLLALRDRLQAEQARQQFFAALAAFQGACPIIPKSKTATITSQRGSYKYSYAPLDVIVRHVSPLLQQHGLSVSFNTAIVDGTLLVSSCTVHHVAGHHETSDFRVPIDAEARMNDAQKVASASTYAKRYAYCNALGILTGDEDDDAGALGGGSKPPFTPPKRKEESKPLGDKALAERAFNRAAPEEAPLTDSELAALDAEDAHAQGSAVEPSDPPKPPAHSAAGPCSLITPAQVKRAHAILNLALKDCPAEQKEAAAKLARAQLYLKLTQDGGRKIEKFEEVPKGKLYDELCDVLIDKAAAWAIRHVGK